MSTGLHRGGWYCRYPLLLPSAALVPLPLGVSAYAKSGNADASGVHARSTAGGMLFGDQWVFCAFVINWYAKEAEDPVTVARFFSAINESLTLFKSSLSKD